MRRVLFLLVAVAVLTMFTALMVLALDPRCARYPGHKACQTTTTTEPPATTTTGVPPTTTTAPPTTTTEPPATTTTAPPATTTTPPATTTTTIVDLPDDAIVIGAVGDVGSWDHSAEAVATLIGSDVVFIVGDLNYTKTATEQDWCDWMRAILGDELPIEVVAGNHEADSGDSGFIRDYAECLPDMLGAVGDYSVQYSVDLGPMTVIAISPDLKISKVFYDYAVGSEERAWLETEIANAKSEGDWVMIAMHKVCITAGGKSCQIGEELANYLVANADLIVSGHEHTYQRSHPLLCVTENDYDPACVGEGGAIWVINGSGGRNWWVKASDAEAPYFAVAMGNNERFVDWGNGTSRFVVTDTEIVGSFICGNCTFTDTFTITR